MNRKTIRSALAAFLVLAALALPAMRIQTARATEDMPQGTESVEDTGTVSGGDAGDAPWEDAGGVMDGTDADIECSVTQIYEGEAYDALAGAASQDGNTVDVQVYEMAVTAGGEPLDLSGCDVTIEATLTDEVISAAGCLDPELGYVGLMEVTVQPLGGEPVTKLVSAAELRTMDGNVSVEATYTVPESGAFDGDGPFADETDPTNHYAVSVSSVETLILDEEKASNPFLSYVIVKEGGHLTIDLNGQTWVRNFSELPDPNFELPGNGLSDVANAAAYFPFVYIYNGGSVDLVNSGSGGGIEASGVQAIVTMQYNGSVSDAPELTVDVGDAVLRNAGGHHVVFTENSANWGREVSSKVTLLSGTLCGADGSVLGSTHPRGGGILAGHVYMRGGEISGCAVNGYGGGVYANEFEMTGGRISGNKSGADGNNGIGGGVAALKATISGGEISSNTANYAGGGIHTYSLDMSGGDVSNNICTGGDVRGGGGIYLESAARAYNTDSFGWPACPEAERPALTVRSEIDAGAAEMLGITGPIDYNMALTGGSVLDNTSDYTGGGIFINNGAKCYVKGVDGRTVHVEGNKALEKYGHKSQGFAGGGIFVEHDVPTGSADTAEHGGFVFVYNAAITGNSALYGGGVAGCGASNVNICSVDGVIVTGNSVHSDRNHWSQGASYDGRRLSDYARDVWVDGKGGVDPVMMEVAKARWEGLMRLGTGPDDPYATVDVEAAPRTFSGPFVLRSDVHTNYDQAMAKVTTFICGNYSATGGGGIGGNGIIKLGVRFSDPGDTAEFLLKKNVADKSGSGYAEKDFDFKVSIQEPDGRYVQTVTARRVSSDGAVSMFDMTASEKEAGGIMTYEFGVDLKAGESILFEGLQVGSSYRITEDGPIDGFGVPGITATNGSVDADDPWSVSGFAVTSVQGDTFDVDKASSIVAYTNIPLYQLPETGGPGDVLIVAGLLLAAFSVAAMARRNRRR